MQESDNSGHITDLIYNTRGDLTQKLDPETSATLSNGLQIRVRPATRYYYDYIGRAVATDDANGNRTSQRYDAAGHLLTEYQALPDGGVKQYGYDVFGNRRFADNEINERTWFTYDAKNQLIRADHPTDANFGNAARFDLYQYDESGRRIRHTNALGAAELTYYDDIGRVKQTTGLQSASFPGIVTQYRYVFDAASGGTKLITVEQTSQGTKTLEDTKDYFGRLLRHVDLGGHTFTYNYNKAGWLVSQTGDTNLAAGGNEQNIRFTYYRNGYLKEEIDSGINTRSKYEYDQNGNRTFEGYAQATAVGLVYYQFSRAQYDELTRVVSIHDPKYDLSYEYDQSGNRRRAFARYHDGLNNDVQTQDYWYAYDSLNRFVITKGTLQGTRGSGTIVAGTTGTQIFYNRASERKKAIYVSNGKTLQDVYDYAVDGLLTKAAITDVTGAPVAVGSATRAYDLVGNVKNYQELDAANASLRSVTYEYNANNTLKKETDSGSGVSNFEYDAAGNLLRVTNPQPAGTTVTTTYAYEYWDTAKQSQIKLQASNTAAPGWKPGFSNFIYDVNGHLTQVNDFGADGQQNTPDDRYLRYALDAEGKILQRNELKGSQSSKTQYYYYLNGIGIGDAGGFGPSQTDYVNVLASRTQPPVVFKLGGMIPRNSVRPNLKDYAANPIGSADFDYNYMPVNDQYPALTPGTYTVRQGDVATSVEETLRNVAMAVWGDASLWYILADANGLNSKSPVPEVGQTLVVPNVITNIHNNASTFKVYNPGQLIGDTTPTLPDPPPPPQPDDDECFRIVATIIVVVVTIVVAVYATEALEAWGEVAAGILGAAAGNAAGQVTAKALGLREHFSWREVGTAALTAGLTNGIDTGNVVTTALLRNAVGQMVSMARGQQEKFDWAALAAAPINSYIDQQTSGVSNATSTVGATSDGFTSDLISGVTKGFVSQGMAILVNRRGKIDWANIAANALGGAIGNAVGADIPTVQDARVRRQEAWREYYERQGYQYEVNPNGSLRVTGISNPAATQALANARANPVGLMSDSGQYLGASPELDAGYRMYRTQGAVWPTELGGEAAAMVGSGFPAGDVSPSGGLPVGAIDARMSSAGDAARQVTSLDQTIVGSDDQPRTVSEFIQHLRNGGGDDYDRMLGSLVLRDRMGYALGTLSGSVDELRGGPLSDWSARSAGDVDYGPAAAADRFLAQQSANSNVNTQRLDFFGNGVGTGYTSTGLGASVDVSFRAGFANLAGAMGIEPGEAAAKVGWNTYTTMLNAAADTGIGQIEIGGAWRPRAQDLQNYFLTSNEMGLAGLSQADRTIELNAALKASGFDPAKYNDGPHMGGRGLDISRLDDTWVSRGSEEQPDIVRDFSYALKNLDVPKVIQPWMTFGLYPISEQRWDEGNGFARNIRRTDAEWGHQGHLHFQIP